MEYRITYTFTDGRKFSELLNKGEGEVRDYAVIGEWFAPFSTEPDTDFIHKQIEALKKSKYASALCKASVIYKVEITSGAFN